MIAIILLALSAIIGTYFIRKNEDFPENFSICIQIPVKIWYFENFENSSRIKMLSKQYRMTTKHVFFGKFSLIFIKTYENAG